MFLLSILLVVLYVGIAIWRKRELPVSVSAMVYDLKGGWRWLWSVWLWAVTICLAPALLSAMESSPLTVLGFATLVSLMFTGMFPLFDESHIRWHNALGILGGILSQVCVYIICPWFLLLWLVMIILIAGAFCAFSDNEGGYRFIDGKGVFIAEAICWLTLTGALFIYLL